MKRGKHKVRKKPGASRGAGRAASMNKLRKSKPFVKPTGIAEVDKQFLAPRRKKEARTGAGKPGRRTPAPKKAKPGRRTPAPKKAKPVEIALPSGDTLVIDRPPIDVAGVTDIAADGDKTHMHIRALTLPPLHLLCDKDGVLATTRRHLATGPALGKNVDKVRSAVLKTAAEVVRAVAAGQLAKQAAGALDEIVETYTAINGPRPVEEGEERDSWDSGLDDQVEALFSDDNVANLVGAGWRGINTIDTQAHEPQRRKEISDSYGLALTSGALATLPDVTDAKILSAAGLVGADLEPIINELLGKGTPDMTTGTQFTEQDYINAWGVVNHIINAARGKMDITELMGDLEQAADSDRILANSSITRLGFAPEDSTYQAFRIMGSVGRHWINDAIAGKQPHPLNVPSQLQVSDEKRKEARETAAEKARREKAEQQQQSGSGLAAGVSAEDAVEVCGALKDCGFGDKELSEHLGVSRATLNNYTSGKTNWKPTQAQVNVLRDLCQRQIGKLGAALVNLG